MRYFWREMMLGLPSAMFLVLALALIVIGGILAFVFCEPVIAIAFLSLGLGSYSVSLAWNSGNRMRAIANLEFREKIAVMNYRIGVSLDSGISEREIKAIEQDVRAALELRRWVAPELFQLLRNSIEDFIDEASKNVSASNVDKFLEILQALKKEVDQLRK